jgi:capsular polysaccharide biosynthesis protein
MPALKENGFAQPLIRGALEDRKKVKPFQVWDFLWRRGPLVLGLGVPAFLLFGLLATPITHPIYKVEGTLLIKQSKEPTLNGKDRESIQGDVGVFQRTLVLRIVDREVLKSALDHLPDEQRPSFLKGLGSTDKAIYKLMSRVKAKEVERTYLIQVWLEADESQGLAETLRAVLSSLIEKLQSEQETQYASRLGYLQSERDKISSRGMDEKKRILDLANRLENRTFLRADFITDLGKMNQIQKLYWEAQAETISKKAALEEAEKNREALSKTSLTPFAEERVADNFGINQIERWTYEKAQDLRASIDGLKPENLDRKYIEERMALMNDYMSSYKKRVGDETIVNLTQKRTFELDTAVIKARNAFESANSSSDQLGIELARANAEAARISDAIFEANELTFGLGQLRDRLGSINTRIDDVELEAKSPLPVVIDKIPVTPEQPTSSNAPKLRVAALAVSFGLVTGICLLFDLVDGRVRSREELAAAIGGPGAVPIPAIAGENEDRGFAQILRDVDIPASRAVLDLALRLYLEHQRGGARLFAFVGIHARSGNTTIALNAARALGLHGLGVLLAEFPTGTPGMALASGLPMVSGTIDPWSKKTKDPESRIDIMPWGEGSAPDSIRSSIEAFLEKASQDYDVVILDLPSIAISDIAQEAAMKCDAVVITVRQNVGLFSDVRHAVDILSSAGVPAVTALLNFSRPEPLRLHSLILLRSGMRSLSVLDAHFKARIASFYAEILNKGGASSIWGKIHRKKPEGGEGQK